MKYLVCPSCKTIEEIQYNEWRDVYSVIADYKFIDIDEIQKEEEEIEEHLCCYHSCGYETKSYSVEDFIVDIDVSGSVENYGKYWKFLKDDLEEIIDKNFVFVEVEE